MLILLLANLSLHHYCIHNSDFCLYGFGATIDVRQLIQATFALRISVVVRLLDVGAQAVLQSATLVFFGLLWNRVTSGLVLLLDNRVTCDVDA